MLFHDRYHGHAEPCDQSNVHAAGYVEPHGLAGGVIVGIIGLSFVIIVMGVIIIRHLRWQKAARESAKDPDENIAPRSNRGEII